MVFVDSYSNLNELDVSGSVFRVLLQANVALVLNVFRVFMPPCSQIAALSKNVLILN